MDRKSIGVDETFSFIRGVGTCRDSLSKNKFYPKKSTKNFFKPTEFTISSTGKDDSWKKWEGSRKGGMWNEQRRSGK